MLQLGLLGLEGAVVVVVHYLALGLLGGYDFDLHGIAAPQRHLEVEYFIFNRVVERGIQDGGNLDPLDETHLDDALAEGSVARNTYHHSTFTSL